MLKALLARMRQGHRTKPFPYEPPQMPERFAGLPELAAGCAEGCAACADACPTEAIRRAADGSPELDLGKCLFCRRCERVCASGQVTFTRQHDLGAFTREGLVRRPGMAYVHELQPDDGIRRLIGRSLKIRQVSAGGCAACELDVNVLNTLAWDMGRFGIQMVASPRHADCILVTGPVSRNMLLALRKTWDAVPRPAFVIACGTCAISGGIYAGSPQVCDGVTDILKPDLYVPGCPPHPAVLLEALVRFMGRRLRND